jgi:hypothetical protein
MARQVAQARERVDDEVGEQAQAINNAWPSSKLQFVLDDILLDDVCTHYGVRYRKERNGVQLASLMSREEIASEIRACIYEIAHV